MVSSILTNNGAMTALQSLKSTQKSLLETQNRISTGLKVSTAKDNAATWAVATSMRSDIANYKQVSENLSVSSSILTTAETAATSISDLVSQIRTKVTSAQNPAVDKAQVQADIDALLDQINSTAAAASFKGVNLVNANGQQRILTSVNGDGGVSTAAYTDLSKQNLAIQAGSLLESLENLTVLSRADQAFSAVTDGVTKLELNVSGGVTIKTGQNLAFQYVDSSNTSRTLTVKVGKDISTSADLIKYLNADSGFSEMFKAEEVFSSGLTVDTGKITISAKNRDSVATLGKYDSTTKTTTFSDVVELQKGTSATLAGSGLNGAGDFTLDPSVRRMDVTFADKPLQLGDSFELKVASTLTASDASETATYKLKVVEGSYATGDLLVGDSDFSYNDNVYVIAVAASDVTNPNTSAKNIADAIQKALTVGATKVQAASEGVGDTPGAAADFAAAAVSGGVFGVSVDTTTGRLSIKTGDALGDQLFSFNSSKTDYQTLLSKLDSATANVANAAATFGTAGNRIDMQKDFLDKLVDTLTTGLGALVDADMSEEAARLQALQVQEQLGTQALSIANQAPQSILSLFR